MAKKKRLQDSGMEIPDYAIENIARVLLPHIQAYYESEEGRKAFEAWKKQQEQKGAK